MKNECYLADCMDIMKDKPDKFYDLAIVDPPYGRYKGISRTGGTWSAAWDRDKKIDKWDKIPDKKYFAELFRVSKHQIICGGNYFDLPPCRCFIIWEKLNIPLNFTLAMCEFLWTSFNENAKIFKSFSNKIKNRIHPTQKPIALYKWLLQNYAEPGWKIFDSHVGSGSIRIACHDMGFWFEGTEIDKDYWQAQEDRFQAHIANGELFETQEIQDLVYQERCGE